MANLDTAPDFPLHRTISGSALSHWVRALSRLATLGNGSASTTKRSLAERRASPFGRDIDRWLGMFLEHHRFR